MNENNMYEERLEYIKSLIRENGINVSRMYNYDRKMKYIVEEGFNQKDNSIIATIRGFCAFGDREFVANNKKGKDICDFSINEIEELLKSISFYDTTFATRKSLVKKYVRWCYNQKIIPSSEIVRKIEGINNDILQKSVMYEKSFFDSYESLVNAIKERLTSPQKGFNERSLHAPYVIAEYLLWYGIKSEYVVEIVKQDIDFENNRIWIKRENKWYYINNEDVMEYIHRSLNDDRYVDSDYLIRTQRHEKISVKDLSNWASRFFGDSRDLDGKEKRVINYSKVYLSGQFERAYQREREDELAYYYTDTRMDEMFDIEAGSSSASQKVNEYYDYCDYFHRDRIRYPTIKTKIEYAND